MEEMGKGGTAQRITHRTFSLLFFFSVRTPGAHLVQSFPQTTNEIDASGWNRRREEFMPLPNASLLASLSVIPTSSIKRVGAQ